jgi:molybdenum cofactor synthesis domain-containing protein
VSVPAARVAILTVSTSRAAGAGGDESGEALEAFVRELGAEVVAREIVSDEQALIEERLRRYCDEERCALVLTTGGTGVAPRDVTPEATLAVLERPVPGIAEAMRLASIEHTKHWMLSRATAGIRGRTLIVNFPGNPRSITQTAAAIAAALPHALALLADAPAEH